MNVAVALVIGTLLAAAIAVSHRYEIVAHGCGNAGGSCAWWVDQWTGRTQLCEYGASKDALNPVCFYTREPTSKP